MWSQRVYPWIAGRVGSVAGFLRQVLIVVGAVAAYFGVRGLTEGDADAAMRNAERVVAIERALGLY